VLLKSTPVPLFCRIINTILRCVDTTHHCPLGTGMSPKLCRRYFLNYFAALSILQFFCRKILPHQQFLTFACRRRSPVKVPNFPLWQMRVVYAKYIVKKGRDYFAGLRVTKRNKATVLLTLTLLQTPTLTLTLILTLT
jgi:hypothetical protein